MSSLPPLDSFDKHLPSLVVVDDLVLSKNQDAISNYFIRCRKLNVSCIYISQGYYLIPKVIRQNCNSLIILKLSTEREIKMIMSESGVGVDRDKLMNIYKEATSTHLTPLIINMDVMSDHPDKFRKGYNISQSLMLSKEPLLIRLSSLTKTLVRTLLSDGDSPFPSFLRFV